MMLPKVILHNSLSIDGSFLHFDVNPAVHYNIALQYRADAHLIGSVTAKTGFENNVPPEEPGDFEKPDKSGDIPLWIIVDSKGVLQGMLHVMRRFEYCRDVIVLVCNETPEKYLQYLDKRKYDYHRVGVKRVDLKLGLSFLCEKYGIQSILTDCGAGLAVTLLNQNLVDELSIVIHPVVAGSPSNNLFSGVKLKHCNPIKSELIDNTYIWNTYSIDKDI